LLWEPLAGALRDLDDDIRWYLHLIESITPPSGDELAEVQHEDLVIELGLAIRAGAELAVLLQSAIATPSRDQIYWIERSQILNRPSLNSAPLHVGDMLGEELFGPLRSIVLTSATMTTDGTFDYIAERVGIEDPDELMVASPFDYQQSTLLYLADDIPEPSSSAYQQRLNETLYGLCTATRGRALVLFTSHAALQATARAIKKPLEDEGIVVLGQRIDGSPRQLIERLRTTPNIVVLGTATFWEGVDIVGPALSLLVITKLPFSVPADPVFAARSELFDNPFTQYAVPQAVLKFKQGFGRLIRSGRDRGVCAVLDRRVLSKRYGESFVQSLPDCTIRIGSMYDLPDEAANWLDESY
jgi:DNA polymerase-3 subunit epsilon/ATP-dependent DNA helicase DinG